MGQTWMALGQEELGLRLGGVEIRMFGVDKNIALMRIRTIPSFELTWRQTYYMTVGSSVIENAKPFLNQTLPLHCHLRNLCQQNIVDRYAPYQYSPPSYEY
jgi:hypothetical protein